MFPVTFQPSHGGTIKGRKGGGGGDGGFAHMTSFDKKKNYILLKHTKNELVNNDTLSPSYFKDTVHLSGWSGKAFAY